MRRGCIFMLLSVIAFTAYSQTNPVVVSRDTNYLYTDTVKNKIYYGNYEPTGLIKTKDTSFIISTQFSIDFPELNDNTLLESDFKKYMEIQNLYSPKLHISSGSIFKLNKLYKKDWEIIFKDRRVIQIKDYDSSCFIAAGENINMRKIWIAKIDLKNGNTIWFKEYAIRHQSTISKLSISSKKDIVVLTENKRIIPFQFTKHYGRRSIRFFKKGNDFEYLLSLSSISGKGKLNWTKTIDFKKNYDYAGDRMIADSNINIIDYYSGFNKLHGKNVKQQGANNYVYNLRGDRLLQKSITSEEGLKVYIKGWIVIKLLSDGILLKKYDDNSDLNITIKTPQKYSRLQSMIQMDGNYYLYGYTDIKSANYLICELDSSFHLMRSWNYKRNNWNDDILLSQIAKNRLIVLGKCYTRLDSARLYQYINLVQLDLK